MCLILYSGLASGSEQDLISAIVEGLQKTNIIFCRTIQELYKALLEPSSRILAVVLIINDRDNLEELFSVRDSLSNRRIILVLPYLNKDIISIGHTLLPRFICSIQDDPDTLISVLNKMKEQNDPV
jgi:hypothetical protein